MNPTRFIRRALSLMALAFLLAPAWTAESTNAPATAPRKVEYSSFRIIAERNIFSPKRSGRQASGPRESRRPPRIDSIALVGTMSYEKGQFAFFDGSSSEFRKTLQRNGSIGSFKVVDITGTSVRLEAKGKAIELHVGSQVRREDDGEWQVSGRRDTFASSSSSSSTGSTGGSSTGASGSSSASESSDSSGAMSEVLKRLLEQREKETK